MRERAVRPKPLAGWVFNIQRFSLHDGPGIRTTVFLKGCPLRCPWCHNPEGLTAGTQPRVALSLCSHCGRCAAACEHGVHEVSQDAHVLHVERCEKCGQCVEACPTGSVELVGQRMDVEAVMAVVRRDAPFYETSGGGMTLSGGEPLAQPEFSAALLRAAREEGFSTAVETSAWSRWQRLADLGSQCDLVIIDIKHTDERRHQALTGVSNEPILRNIRLAAEAGWPLLLRVPWVPGSNVDDTFLEGLIAFLQSLPKAPPVELMLYHRLGESKWPTLGGASPMPPDTASAAAEDAAGWLDQLRAAGIEARTS